MHFLFAVVISPLLVLLFLFLVKRRELTGVSQRLCSQLFAFTVMEHFDVFCVGADGASDPYICCQM